MLPSVHLFSRGLPLNIKLTIYHNTDDTVFTLPVKRVKIIVMNVFFMMFRQLFTEQKENSMTASEDDNYIDGDVFHSGESRIYRREESPEDLYFKESSHMARVVYQRAHENWDFPEDDPKHGSGYNYCKWITSEQPGTAENFSFNSNLNAMIESSLEPYASLGWHTHYDTEEYYYVLAGSIYVECRDENGSTYGRDLHSGDLHRIKKGMSHYAIAGSEGVKFVAVIIKAV